MSRGISSISIDYVEGILSKLSEKFIDTSTGVSKKKVPINILNDIPSEGAGGLALNTNDVVELFVETQLFFLYKDEYYAGFSCDTPEQSYYALDFILRNLQQRCYDEDFVVSANGVKLVQFPFKLEDLPFQKHPMRILANTCVATAEENNEMISYTITYFRINSDTQDNSETLTLNVKGSRQLNDAVKAITQSNIFKISKISKTDGTEASIISGDMSYNTIQAIKFGNI